MRLEDNPAFQSAMRTGLPIIPLFILDAKLLQDPATRRQNFLFQALQNLYDNPCNFCSHLPSIAVQWICFPQQRTLLRDEQLPGPIKFWIVYSSIRRFISSIGELVVFNVATLCLNEDKCAFVSFISRSATTFSTLLISG